MSVEQQMSKVCRLVRESVLLARRLRRDAQGTSLLETALSLSVLLSTVTTVIGFSEAAYAKHFVAAAARQGTRYAMVRGSTYAGVACNTTGYNCETTAADIQARIRAQVPLGLSSSAVTVTSLWPGLAGSGLNCLALTGADSPGCNVQVTVTYAFQYLLPYLPKGISLFSSTSTLTIVQ